MKAITGGRSRVRPKAAAADPPKRRSGRENADNVVVDAQSPAPGTKPSLASKGAKTPVKDSVVPPAKLPTLSPFRNVVPEGVEAEVVMDQAIGSKRKLNMDVAITEAATNPAPVDLTDSGVKVIVRVRPLNQKETAEDATNVVQKLSVDSMSLGDQQFTFDSVADETESQEAVFEMVGRPMVENCLAGFNSSIFAYGQTGSGKTHTMWGLLPSSGTEATLTEDRGITPRVFEQLFARIQQEERNNIETQLRYQCRCSFLEIYNEQITDLLEPSRKNLMIREDTKTGVYVEGLTEEYVSNMDDVISILVRGSANRRVGSTAMNNESSRSHSVFTFVIESRSKSVADGVSSVRTSRMNLVDLAGSERQKQTGAAGDRLKEAGNINKSLSQLGNVINILAEVAQTGKHRHIPYRSSRLTFLLQESLGGNAKLAMICAVSPASSCRTETLSTLRFAQRAKSIQNKAVVNEETGNDVNLLREQIKQLKDELMRMKENGTHSEGTAGRLSSGWNARRSYNLLRLSLGQPMTIAPMEMKEIEEEIEQDEDEFTDACTTLVDMETQELMPKNETESADSNEANDVSKGLPELTLSLVPPTLSISPKVKEGKREEFGVDISFGLPKSPLGLRSSKAFASSTDQLAATLTRGIEILDNHPRHSLSIGRRSSGVRFSFQNGESPRSPKCETSPVLARLNNFGNTAGAGEDLVSPQHEISAPTTHAMQTGEPAALPEMAHEDWKIVPCTPPAQIQHSQGSEVLLAGALRREKAAEETIAQQAADLEQLSRLVRQYKLEREYNAAINQSREEKIVRMESLMDGALSSKEYHTDELAALTQEYKILQEKYDHHPELAEAKAEQQLLRHELHRYKALCDVEELEKLQQEVLQLRNQVQLYLETDTPGSMKQRRLSLTPAQSVQPAYSPIKLMSPTAVPESMPSCESASSSRHVEEEPEASSVESHALDVLEQERREWDQREREFMSMVQELRDECEHHKQLAEKWRKELEGEKRCTLEMHEALQMSIAGHARILDQYAELQEKHVQQLATMREIRQRVIKYKKEARDSGLCSVDEMWFDAQATQITLFKVEQERFKEQIEGLQARLDDTADAVQAAGELLVRLKESEQAATLAKHTATMAEGYADEWRRELEETKRRHAKELTSLQHRLSNSALESEENSAETAIVVVSGKTSESVSDLSDGPCVYESSDAAGLWRGGDDDDPEAAEKEL